MNKFPIEVTLTLDSLAYQILYSYEVIQSEFEDIELRRGIVNWRKEILDGIKNLKIDQIRYVLSILRLENERVYLEVKDLYNQYNQDNQDKKQNKENQKLKIFKDKNQIINEEPDFITGLKIMLNMD